MGQENRFNLIEEPWIPVADVGRVSLRQIFTHPEYRSLGGDPVKRIAITKLLLAIAQAAKTPIDDSEWAGLKEQGMANACLAYLDKWNGKFWLYGQLPFLQYPELEGSKLQTYGAVLPEVATGNTTVLTESQIERPLEDAERAVLLVCLMGFGLGGKKTDNSVVLSKGYQGKSKTGKPGSLIGFMGYLHSFLQGSSILKSLWLNLLSQQQVHEMKFYDQGLGVPPWEEMPIGENDSVAVRLQQSLMGRLVPLSRFC